MGHRLGTVASTRRMAFRYLQNTSSFLVQSLPILMPLQHAFGYFVDQSVGFSGRFVQLKRVVQFASSRECLETKDIPGYVHHMEQLRMPRYAVHPVGAQHV